MHNNVFFKAKFRAMKGEEIFEQESTTYVVENRECSKPPLSRDMETRYRQLLEETLFPFTPENEVKLIIVHVLFGKRSSICDDYCYSWRFCGECDHLIK